MPIFSVPIPCILTNYTLTIDQLLARVAFVPECGCWLWTQAWDKYGYGTVTIERKRVKRHISAHRMAWELFIGPIPPDTFVCHKCDTPACCNPNHLFIGTHTDNIRDASRKGRLNFPRSGRPRKRF